MKALQIARRRPRPGEAGSAAAAWPRKLLTGVVAALLASGAAALAYRAATGPGAAAPPVQRKPDPQVSVTVAQRTDLPIRVLAEGHVTPLNQVDLRPEVSGTVKQVHFREGEEVRAGQLLFTLDASEAEAQLARARAGAAQAQAQVQEAVREHERSIQLGRANFISASAVDTAAGKVQLLRAVLDAANAEVQSARLAVERMRIAAPINGRAGRLNVHPGSLAQPTAQAPLVTLVQFDVMGVDFSIPEADLPALLAAASARQTRIRLQGADGSTPEGRLVLIGNAVNPATGTIDVRAEFPNKDRKLWPGAFVRVSLEAGMERGAVVLPMNTVLEGPQGRFVFVIRQDGAVKQMPVKLARMQDRMAVVEGLRGGEPVVAQGARDLRDGAHVRVVGEGPQ